MTIELEAPHRMGHLEVAGHPPTESGRIGVLLVNLGTPEAAESGAVRRYLREFLTDPRVIELPRLLWRPILEGFVLTTRPQRRVKDYLDVWNHEQNESPLKTITRAQAEALALRAAGGAFGEADRVRVDWAMRYGRPTIDAGIRNLQARGCDRLLIVPLYPQYCAATTATVCDKAFETLAKLRWQPALRVAPPWYDDPVYIEAVAQSVKDRIAEARVEPDLILASFHGMPRATLDKGDPYYCQCAVTTRLLRDRLGLPDERLALTFQSRFGKAEWLQPYTDETIKAAPSKGVETICVVTPGFVADCLETISEIGVENKDYFEEAGGRRFLRVDCLNAGALGAKVLESVVARETRGWL